MSCERTGAEPDLEPPTTPEIMSVEARAGGGWTGLGRWLELHVRHDGILIGDSDGVLGNMSVGTGMAAIGWVLIAGFAAARRYRRGRTRR